VKIIFLLSAVFITPLMAVEQAVENVETVHVGGQVGKPGPVAYRKKTTVFSMIFAAGGPTQFGDMQRVKVYREGKTILVDFTDDRNKAKLLAKSNDSKRPKFIPWRWLA
jgi:protein involved in polysaccharide export with SLBB domain